MRTDLKRMQINRRHFFRSFLKKCVNSVCVCLCVKNGGSASLLLSLNSTKVCVLCHYVLLCEQYEYGHFGAYNRRIMAINLAELCILTIPDTGQPKKRERNFIRVPLKITIYTIGLNHCHLLSPKLYTFT